MRKGLLIALGACLALVAGIIFIPFTVTHGVVEAGDAFLSRIGSGKIREAYESASATLRSQQTEREFEEGVKKLGLTDYASASWSNHRMENDRGQLEGSAVTRSGGKIPLRIELVNEAGQWKIYSLSAPQPGVIVQNVPKSIPSEKELNALVLETLLAFNNGVKEKSFVALREQGSSAFREVLSAEKLLESFKGFIEKGVDISSIEKVPPVFENAPVIDSEGVLILKGYYPTKPKQVVFGIKYALESSGWKLHGLDINIPNPTGAHPLQPVPPDEKLKEMALGSLRAFRKAIQQRSFASFRKECCAQLREKVSVEEMNDAFRQFMDNGVDFSSIEKGSPVFDAPAQVNPDGELTLSGNCPEEPVVGFLFKYVYENGRWQIIEVNVDGFKIKYARHGDDAQKLMEVGARFL